MLGNHRLRAIYSRVPGHHATPLAWPAVSCSRVPGDATWHLAASGAPGRLSSPLPPPPKLARCLVPSRPAAAEVHEEIEAKKGLPSADRNNKATLLLTGPFRTSKSSAKDLTPLVLKLQFAKYHYSLREQWRNRLLRR